MPKPRHKSNPIQKDKAQSDGTQKTWRVSNSRRNRSETNKPAPAPSTKSSAAPSKPLPRQKPPKSNPEEGPSEIRLHRYLAQCGIASRRKAEELILQGKVSINGELVIELGTKVSPGDSVEFEGNPVHPPETRLYLYNKPIGVVTTMDDDRNRPSVGDQIPDAAQGIKPVGRLDMNTQGLIFLTNDGDLAHRLSHPRYGIEKEYVAVVAGVPSDKTLARLSRGVVIDGEKTAPSEWVFVATVKNENQARLRITLHEGRNRQIRKMAEMVGHPVVSLRRVRIGSFRVKGMEEGEMRLIGKKDYDKLRESVGL